MRFLARTAASTPPISTIAETHAPSDTPFVLQSAPPRLRRALGASLVAAALLVAGVGGADDAGEAATAAVRLGDRTVFVLRRGRGTLDADARANEASRALTRAMAASGDDDVHVERRGDTAVVLLGKAPVVELDAEDAKLAGVDSPTDHAESVAASIRVAVSAERQRSRIARTVFSISLVVFLGLVALYLIRKAGEVADRLREWLARHPDRVPAVRLQTIELASPAVLGGFLQVALSLGKWLAQLGIAYTWLVVVLSMFESTRGLTQSLTGVVISPLAAMTGRIATALPVVFVAGTAALAIFLLLRFVALFFRSVEAGESRLDWLAPELAGATSVLVRAAIVLIAVIFFAPLVTGAPEGAVSRLGFVAVGALALAATPLLASVLAGSVVLFGRRITVGQHVRIGQRCGRVTRIDLLHLTLQDQGGDELRIPHLLTLFTAISVNDHSDALHLPFSFPLAASGASPLDEVERVVRTHDEAARVELLAIHAAHVDCIVHAVADPEVRSALTRDLLELATRMRRAENAPT